MEFESYVQVLQIPFAALTRTMTLLLWNLNPIFMAPRTLCGDITYQRVQRIPIFRRICFSAKVYQHPLTANKCNWIWKVKWQNLYELCVFENEGGEKKLNIDPCLNEGETTRNHPLLTQCHNTNAKYGNKCILLGVSVGCEC